MINLPPLNGIQACAIAGVPIALAVGWALRVLVRPQEVFSWPVRRNLVYASLAITTLLEFTLPHR